MPDLLESERKWKCQVHDNREGRPRLHHSTGSVVSGLQQKVSRLTDSTAGRMNASESVVSQAQPRLRQTNANKCKNIKINTHTFRLRHSPYTKVIYIQIEHGNMKRITLLLWSKEVCMDGHQIDTWLLELVSWLFQIHSKWPAGLTYENNENKSNNI